MPTGTPGFWGPASGFPYPPLPGLDVPVGQQLLPIERGNTSMPSWPAQRPYKRFRQVRPGDWILIFGTASRVLKVETHQAYPHAVLLRLRPAGHADDVQTLVPADYEPVLLSFS